MYLPNLKSVPIAEIIAIAVLGFWVGCKPQSWEEAIGSQGWHCSKERW